MKPCIARQRYHQRVRLAREAKSWTIEKAAQISGVSSAEWADWEAGGKELSFHNGRRAAKAMGTTVYWLLYAEGVSPLCNRQLGPLE